MFLITGAAGHLGSTIVSQLVERGEKVRILVLPDEKNIPKGNIQVFFGDVTKLESLYDFFENSSKDIQILIHCAGIVSISTAFNEKVYDVNVNGTKNIVDLCVKYGVEKLIYISSVHAIKEKVKGNVITETNEFDPNNVVGLYAKTKAEATAYVLKAEESGLNVNIIHPSGLCGPLDNNMGYFTTLVIDHFNNRLTLGANGGYDFVDVRDVAKGIISCALEKRKGECYILSNEYYTVKEILDLLYTITGKNKVKIFLPIWFLKVTASLSEIYYKLLNRKPLFTTYSIYTLNSNAVFSHEKASKELGYKTREMKETLEDTINWLKENKMI